MIVVVDSGIWISAIEFGGTPAAALERLVLIDDLAICAEIEDEIYRVMLDKFGRDREAVKVRLASFLGSALRVEVTGGLRGVCRDPNDDCILECALNAKAQIIITGDKDLLEVGSYLGIRVLKARQYVDGGY